MFGVGNGKKYHLFKLLGVPVYADVTAALLPIIVLLFYGQGGPQNLVLAVFVAAIIFFSIVFHEVGHAVAIRRLGYGQTTITLSGIGGVTQWHGAPARKHRIIISLAGPAASVLLAVIGGAAYYGSLKLAPDLWLLNRALFFLLAINVFWAVFNLLPIYPMDGGKVTRTALGYRMTERKAAMLSLKISGAVGAVVAAIAFVMGEIFIFVLLAFLLMTNWNEWQRLTR